ncbi:ABC transporter permease [Geothrix sp. 21YS21S-2]|uniref:ABC transporter permease n=1 Tax=Geothrix sp. 21YS21S-2 TaxID=3068893 RepID=UPI0027BAACD4|nr:ABC transporter permease [Geothrix sp. 21YS21S-2]
MNRLATNLRWALRSLAGTPGFTAMAVLILALGIGANAAIFGLVDRALLRPLDYPGAERLVAVWETHTNDGSITSVSPADFLDWRREARGFDALAAVCNTSVNVAGGIEPARAFGLRASWTFFRVVGVAPALGRGFLPEEDATGASRVVILSHGFWMRQFGGDPAVVGRSVSLDGSDALVVGVMPRGFRFDFMGDRLDLILPAAFSAEETERRGWHFLGVVGRLAPGMKLAGARSEMTRVAAALAVAHPASNTRRSAQVVPLRDELVRDARGTLLFLLGAVAFVLLAACANLLNLMLARKARRQRDQAIRTALGASPWDLGSQALTESALLGLLGGLAGWLPAQAAMSGLVRLLALPAHLDRPGWDFRMAGFILLLSVATALVLGLAPGPGATAHNRLRGVLVTAEVALTTLLLVGAGLMVRSLSHLRTLDPGFQPDQLVMATLTVPARAYPALEDRAAFIRRLRDRVEAIPGVASAAASDTLPFAGSTWTTSYDVEGQPAQEGRIAIAHHVSPAYFRTMGIPLLRGRELEQGERDGAVVSRRFARRHFGEGDPLGRRVALERGQWLRVVGVAGDVRHNGLARDPEPEIYLPLTLGGPTSQSLGSFALVARGPAALAPALRGALREVDPDLPLGTVRAMASLVDQDRQATRAGSVLLGAFAALALLLAAVGIYAVLSFITGMRRRELGIRMALGATARDILGLVLGQGLRWIGAGIACGLAGAVALGRFIQSQIHGVRAGDPATLGAAALLLVAVGLAACLLPALRALRVDPWAVLRSE